MSYIKNASGQSLGFCLVNSSGVAVTGATVTAKRSIDMGGQATATGSVTELGNGQYCLCLSQADSNGDNITFLFTATGAVPVEKTIVTCNSSQNGAYLGVPPPIIPTGRYILPPYLKSHGNLATTSVASRYYIAPFFVPRTTIFAGVKFWNSSTGDSGKKVKVAFYNESASGGPGTLAKDFGELTLNNTNALRTLSSSWTAAGARWYYGMLTTDSAVGFYGMAPCVTSNYHAAPGLAYLGLTADLVARGVGQEFHGDYVDGTYANFPESTGLAAAQSIAQESTVSNAYFPQFGLYT